MYVYCVNPSNAFNLILALLLWLTSLQEVYKALCKHFSDLINNLLSKDCYTGHACMTSGIFVGLLLLKFPN